MAKKNGHKRAGRIAAAAKEVDPCAKAGTYDDIHPWALAKLHSTTAPSLLRLQLDLARRMSWNQVETGTGVVCGGRGMGKRHTHVIDFKNRVTRDRYRMSKVGKVRSRAKNKIK